MHVSITRAGVTRTREADRTTLEAQAPVMHCFMGLALNLAPESPR